MRGKVKRWLGRAGYGFIKGEDGNTYFVSHTDIPGRDLRRFEKVDFTPVETPKGLRATKVKEEQ